MKPYSIAAFIVPFNMSSGNLSETVEASDWSLNSSPGTASTASTESDQQPREVEVLLDPLPYAQLCFPLEGNRERLCIVMIGKTGSNATAGLRRREYKPLAIERDLDNVEEGEKESPNLGHISSSKTSDTQISSGSSDDIVELEDLGWASNGWNDLRTDSSSLSSEGSSGWASTIDDSSDDGHMEDSQDDSLVIQCIQWLDEIQDSYSDSAGLYSDAWRLLGESSIADHSFDNSDTMDDILDAWGCGRLKRGVGLFRGGNAAVKPYERLLRRQRHDPIKLSTAAEQPVVPASNEYTPLV